MKVRLFIGWFLFATTALFGKLNGNDDFQFWHNDRFTWKVNDRVQGKLAAEWRWGDDLSKLYITFVEAGPIIKATDWLDFALLYRQIWTSVIAQGKWRPVYNPLADAILKGEWRKWKWNDRNRVQYLIFESRDNLWEYRNRLTITSPWKIGFMKLNPFAFDEVFFREKLGFHQNRLAFGFHIPFTKDSTGSIYYLLRHIEIRKKFKRHHVFNVYMHFKY